MDRYMERQGRHALQEQRDMRDLLGLPGQLALPDPQDLQLLQEGGHRFH